MKIIKSNKYVIEAKNVKTILIGPNKFKLVVEITYELDVSFFKDLQLTRLHQKLTDKALANYRDVIDQIVYQQEYEDRQDYIEQVLDLLPKRFMKEIQIQVIIKP